MTLEEIGSRAKAVSRTLNNLGYINGFHDTANAIDVVKC